MESNWKAKQGHQPRPSLDASQVPHTVAIEMLHAAGVCQEQAASPSPSASLSSSFFLFATVHLACLCSIGPSFQTIMLQRLMRSLVVHSAAAPLCTGSLSHITALASVLSCCLAPVCAEKNLKAIRVIMDRLLPNTRLAFVGDGPSRAELEEFYADMPQVKFMVSQGLQALTTAIIGERGLCCS